MACAERRLGRSAHPFLIQTLMRCVLSLDVRPLPGVSPIEPAHPPFKNVDALTCPGHGHGVFGDEGPGCVPIVDINEICRSDQIAAFGEGGPHCQNACGVRRKIGAVCRYGCCALCQLFRRDGGYDGEQHGTFNPSDLACFAARAADVARTEEHTSELQSLMRISYADFCLK